MFAVRGVGGIGNALRGRLGLAQETQGGGEVVGRLPGAGMVLPDQVPRPGEGVLTELASLAVGPDSAEDRDED